MCNVMMVTIGITIIIAYRLTVSARHIWDLMANVRVVMMDLCWIGWEDVKIALLLMLAVRYGTEINLFVWCANSIGYLVLR